MCPLLKDAPDHDRLRLFSCSEIWTDLSEDPEATMIDVLINILGYIDGQEWSVRPRRNFAKEIRNIGSSATRSGRQATLTDKRATGSPPNSPALEFDFAILENLPGYS
eukprot:scaffold10406_cov140-Cylindrotheca_fusiformis.AAC.1